MMLAYFGADVIKVEPPDGGDPLRTWRHVHDGTALWWYAMGRNKRCITCDLRQEEGRALVRRLVEHCDVLVENFRPGRMEAWGLGYDALKAINPRLIMVRISGFGQTGPYARRPGFIQRSAVPPSFLDAAAFLKWFEAQSPELVATNNIEG